MTENPTGDVAVDATTSDAGEIGSVDSPVSDELSEVAPQKSASDTSSSQEQSTNQEQKPDDPAESKDLKTVRDWGRSLERDLKQKFQPAYTGLEKAATALYGTQTPEDIQATIQTVQAMAPQLRVLTDPTATEASVVSTLQSMLPAEHMEALTWAALNSPASQAVILNDPEVRRTIEERLFEGRTIEDVQAILADVPGEVDPERDAMRRELAAIRAEKQRETSERNERAIQERTQGLMTRFFEAPAQQVIVDDFKLVAPEGATDADKSLFADTGKDIRFAAQGRFLEENMDAFMQIQNLYVQGREMQAQAAEIRLQNKYHATLIKTAERHANLLKARSVSQVNGQQRKIDGIRPDVTGSVQAGEKQEERWDIDAPDFAQKFAASFHN